MPRWYAARAIPIRGLGEDVALHRILLPVYGEPGFNRMIRSVTWFRSGTQKGYIHPDYKGRGYDTCGWDHGRNILYSLNREDDQLREERIRMKTIEAIAPEAAAAYRAKREAVPVIDHASLYDFYDYIGFDRHKRRYIHGEKIA